MPIVADALSRMRMVLQEMRYSRVKAVKLIHGYGSTGRGGKIRIGVRDEFQYFQKCRGLFFNSKNLNGFTSL